MSRTINSVLNIGSRCSHSPNPGAGASRWARALSTSSTAAQAAVRQSQASIASKLHAEEYPSFEIDTTANGSLKPSSPSRRSNDGITFPISSPVIYTKDTGKVIIHNALVARGVDRIYGIPARSIFSDPFDNIYCSKSIRTVIPVQEQYAGHMAEGYARATGKAGVVMATSPYAIPSLVTPMQDSLADGTPMVVLSSFCPSTTLGSDEFQVPDTMSMAAACTKWSTRVETVEELGPKIAYAFEIAHNGRPGPVMLEIPASVTVRRLTPRLPPPALRSLPPTSPGSFIAPFQDLGPTLDKVSRLIDIAKKPILYVGQGILAHPEGPAVLKAFADKTNIPVTTTLQGLGAFDEYDDKSLHMLGLHGAGYANLAIQEADLILAIGARFDDRVTGALSKFAPKAHAAAATGFGGIVHFEIAPKNVNKVVQATEVVVGDCATNLALLTPRVRQVSQRPEWYSQINEWKRRFPLSAYKTWNPSSKWIKPQEVIEKLSDMTAGIKDRVLITTGVGQHQMWAAQHYRWQHPRTMLTSGGLGTMGYGLPAAIGAKVSRPDCLVIDIDGDGSFSMTISELATMAQQNIAVKVLLFNNEELGMVSDIQRLYYDERYAHNKFAHPDFVRLSEAYGVAATRAVDPAEIEKKLQWLIDYDGPAVLEVVSEKENPVWPVVPAGKGLHEFITYPEVGDQD